MNKLLLFVTLIIFSNNLKAQINPSLSLGLGAGGVTTFAGASVIKSTFAYNGYACYNLSEYFDISLEAQTGKLAGGNPYTPHLNFKNNYQAAFAEVRQRFGGFFENPDDFFSEFASNVYLEAGLGLIHNRVTQINKTIDHTDSVIPIIPLRAGYLWSIKNSADDEIIKVNFSYSINPTIGRGIDGYFGPMKQAEKFYIYYGIGLEYTFDLSGDYGGRRIKF